MLVPANAGGTLFAGLFGTGRAWNGAATQLSTLTTQPSELTTALGPAQTLSVVVFGVGCVHGYATGYYRG
ncbi:MAG TPA: hypothetical protein VMB79_12790 [Jatrophihabitans sp.]|nr:hypothetical protein [Jatrophihabitans sp.]